MSNSSNAPAKVTMRMKHMGSFQCAGSECPNTCCHGWRVLLNKQEHDRIQRTLLKTSNGSERFQLGIERFEGHPHLRASQQHFAVIKMEEESRDCTFMTSEGWCGLQNEFGEEVLGDVCYAYPRQLKRFGSRLELTGSLGCPEVVRGALLDATGCDWEEVSTLGLGREVIAKRTTHTDASPYVASLDLVREVFQTVLDVTEVTLPTRLLMLGMFGMRLRPVFNQGAAGPGADESFQAELTRLLQPKEFFEAQRFLDTARVSVGTLAQLMQTLVSVSATGTEFDRFRALSRDVINSYLNFANHETSVADDASSFEVPTSTLFDSYFALSRWLDGQLGEVTSRIEHRFCTHYVNSHWHTECPDLVIYVQRLVSELGLMRFLCAGHPKVLSFLSSHGYDSGKLPESLHEAQQVELESLWGEVYVDVVHLLARSTEHSPSTLSELDTALAQSGLEPLAVLTYLLKL